MNTQARVGLFALVGLIGLFLIYFVLSDFATSRTGYRIGVHFVNAAGLHKGALVYESGVNIGSVDEVRLLEDFTVSVILAIRSNIDIPRESRFLIQAPLTGDPTLVIVPPAPRHGPGDGTPPTLALLPREIEPVDRQPQGANPVSIADLLAEGQGQLAKVDQLLTDLQKREPALLNAFQSAVNNANEITVTTNGTLQRLTKRVDQMADILQSSLTVASGNVVDLTRDLNVAFKSDNVKVDKLFGTVDHIAQSLNATTDSLKSLATNTEVHDSLISTTKSIAATTKNIADLTGDLRQLTGNPQTQAQLRDTIANVNAASQKANSLLGQLGGKSSVYGVDAGATPAPGMTPIPALTPGGFATPSPGGRQPNVAVADLPGTLKSKIGLLTKNLASVQIRITELNKQAAHANSSPLLTTDQGPQTDVNLVLLPTGRTALFTGFNDIGANSSVNFAALQRVAPGARVGAGILYSRLGALGSVSSGVFGLEGRIYDVRRPTLDAYGSLAANSHIKAFLGERDMTRTGRRTVLGLQLQF